jgi:hypothetical protein
VPYTRRPKIRAAYFSRRSRILIGELERLVHIADPATRARLAAASTTPIIHTPESFGAFMVGEVEKWGKVTGAAGTKPE